MATRKPNVDTSGLNKNTQEYEAQENPNANGVAGTHIVEPVPKFIKAENERAFEGSNNACIVLGRDRPASRLSGYGGTGHTQCGAIDIVVGRATPEAKTDNYVDPDFRKDAARIHISQKTDVDENFKLAEGTVGSAKAKSAIALKADGIRIIAREGIKIVTGTDKTNSQGGSIDTNVGVNLIAGNDDSKLQPAPLGQNLIDAFIGMSELMENLSGIVGTFLSSQQQFNSVAGGHTHVSPFFGSVTVPSPELGAALTKAQMNQTQDCTMGLSNFKANIVSWKQNHLYPSGKCYVNSRYHKLN